MDVKIVNRRGKTMHIFVCALPGAERDRATIRDAGYLVRDGSYLFGKPSTPQFSGQDGFRVTTTFHRDLADGDTCTFSIPAAGALLWLRGAMLVGPWWLTPIPSAPGHAVYRPEESRLVIGVGGDSGILHGIDGILRGAEAQYAGRIRKDFVAAGAPDPNQTVDPEAVLLEVANILIGGASTFLAAAGPVTGVVAGALVLSGGLMNSLTAQPSQNATLDVDAIGQRMQAIMDDRDAAVMATTLVTTADELADHRQNFTEALLATSVFTADDRDTYYTWKAGNYDLSTPGAAAKLDAIRAKLSDLVNPPPPLPSVGARHLSWPKQDAYRAFLRESLGASNDTFFWCMNHLAGNRPLLRRCLPEFLLGIGVFATISVDAIGADVAEGRVTLTPSLFRDVAADMGRYLTAFTEALDEVRGEMDAVIDSNGLGALPERIEVLRFYSQRFFGSADILFDPKLASIPRHESFGIHYGEYWNHPGTIDGPRIDEPIRQAKNTIGHLSARAARIAAGANG
ncbi:MAG: hypothetical protein U1E59_13845 [Amaricoccus sp.]